MQTSKNIAKEKKCHWSDCAMMPLQHSARGMTLDVIRCRGFWIICGISVINSAIFKCVTCCKLIGKIGEQMMADLPKNRFKEVPPFTYCVVGMFEPFTVRVNRSDMKRYGVMFNCLVSWTVHIEVTYGLDTNLFIQTLRR